MSVSRFPRMTGFNENEPKLVQTYAAHTHLENANVRESVWSHCAAVDRDVFEPLDVRLRVAEHAANKRHIAANDCGLVGGQTELQERPVRRALWNTKNKHLRLTSARKPCLHL